MKIKLQFLAGYLLLVILLLTFHYNIVSELEEELQVNNERLSGVKYLENLTTFSTSASMLLENFTSYEDLKKSDTVKKDILKYIKKHYEIEKENPNFVDSVFNDKLNKYQTFEMSNLETYQFLDSINHKIYNSSDVSNLLFEDDRELYFLSTLMAHYMPEYLISLTASRSIMEQLKKKSQLSDALKNIFIEQTKLVYLSAEELTTIIKLLARYKDTNSLQESMKFINTKLFQIQKYIPTLYPWDKNLERLHKYLSISHKIVNRSLEFNDDYIILLQERLIMKKEGLLKTVLIYNLSMVLLLIILTLITYFFYKLYRTNILKDRQIKDILKTLDELVIFSKSDLDGNITYASSALVETSGYSLDELIGENHRIFRHPDTDKAVYTELWNTILKRETFVGDILNRKKDGTSYWVHATIVPDLDENGNLQGFIAYRINTTHEKALESEKIKTLKINEELNLLNQELERLSTVDTLTKIYNRLKLDILMKKSFQSFQRYNKVFSLILIDIDYFKKVNDVYGHLKGDEVLKEMATLLSKNIRETDIDGAYKLGEHLRKTTQEHKFTTPDQLTISLGVTQIEKDLSVESFIKMADDALYRAKEAGRNTTIKELSLY